jgi:hypothetical protein
MGAAGKPADHDELRGGDRMGFRYLLRRRDVEAFARKMRKPSRPSQLHDLKKASAKKKGGK